MQRPRSSSWLVTVVILVAAAGASYFFLRPRPTSLRAAPWPLAGGIDHAAEYLARATGPDGRFVYLRSLAGDPVAPGHYNVLRHAGAIYALAAYEKRSPSRETRPSAAAAGRAAGQLVDTYVRPLRSNAALSAVWSDPKEEGEKDRRVAKLGGSALGVIGLVELYGTTHDEAQRSAAVGLGRFIVSLQKPAGEYQAKFSEDATAPSTFESLYYPGEATLALTMLYELDPDPVWLDTALRGVGHLVISRRGKSDLPADHWLMIAIDRLLPVFDRAKNPPITKQEMLEHASALGRVMLSGETWVHEHRPEIDGCFTKDGRTTPTATRLEGLLALEHAIAAHPARAAERKTVRIALARGVSFLRRAQLGAPASVEGGFPATVTSDGKTHEAEDEQPDQIRIDYVQHAMSAFMRYETMCAADPTDCP